MLYSNFKDNMIDVENTVIKFKALRFLSNTEGDTQRLLSLAYFYKKQDGKEVNLTSGDASTSSDSDDYDEANKRRNRIFSRKKSKH